MGISLIGIPIIHCTPGTRPVLATTTCIGTDSARTGEVLAAATTRIVAGGGIKG
jgi:hypothetical protein